MMEVHHHGRRHPAVWGIVLIVIGLMFLLANFGYLDLGVFIARFWPIILVVIGLKLLLRASRKGTFIGDRPGNRSAEEISNSTAGQIYRSHVFGDLHLHIQSQDFRGGSVSNVFGDLDIDLSQVDIPSGEHRLNLNGVFGSIDIQLPKKVPFSVQGSCTFGDVQIVGERQSGISSRISYQSEGYDAAEKKLAIKTHQVFGDVKAR